MIWKKKLSGLFSVIQYFFGASLLFLIFTRWFTSDMIVCDRKC